MAFNVIFSQQTKRRNSTAAVGADGEAIACSLKRSCSFHNPTFELHNMGTPVGYNYCVVPHWGNVRYFVDDWEWSDTHWIAHCSFDYLGTYRTNILEMNAYALYSDSLGNPQIVDNRISGEYVNNYYVLATGSAFWTGLTGDWYIVRTIGASGGISGYVMSRQQFDTLASVLGGQISFDTTADLQYSDALGCIVGAMHFPICPPSSSGANPVYLGQFNTGLTALYADYIESGSVILSWNRIYNDWRDGVFVNYSLWLPFVGTVTIAASDIGGLSTLGVYYTIDWMGGGIMYKIYAGTARIASYSGLVGNSVPVTGYMGNALGAVGGAIDAAGNAAGMLAKGIAGDLAGAAASGVQVASSLAGAALSYKQKTATVIGGTTGCAYAGADASLIILSAVATIASDTPANIRSVAGLPAMKNVSVAECSGYLQTAGFSVSGIASAEEKDKINAMMDSGVFIE